MKIKYFRPDTNAIVYLEDDKLFELCEDNTIREINEYFIHSPMWNGPSPYYHINDEADSWKHLIKKNKNVFDIYVAHSMNIIVSMINIYKNYQDDEVFEDCEGAAISVVVDIFRMLRNE
jgi:hypothetical protein